MQKNRLRLMAPVSSFCSGLMLAFSGSAMAYSEKDPMVLKASIDNPPGDMKAKTIKYFGDIVEKRTNGRIKFEYFYGGSLTKKPQYVDAVAKGIADISTGPVSFVTGKLPELSVFEVYGAYKLDKHLEMEKAVEPLMTEYFKEKGIKHLLIQYSGSVVFPHKPSSSPSRRTGRGRRSGSADGGSLSSARSGGKPRVPEPGRALHCASEGGHRRLHADLGHHLRAETL